MTTALSQGYLQNFRRRVIQDALAEATAAYWRRRATAFEWARPRPGDWPGQATDDDIAARDQRLARIAQACHNAARIALTARTGP